MLGSYNGFFKQGSVALSKYRFDLIELLYQKGFNYDRRTVYLNAYDYFCKNTDGFDGATVVKDLYDIKDLDLSAMLHDYLYLVLNVASNLVYKFKADRLYGISMTRLGKRKKHENKRVIGLIFTTFAITPYSIYQRGFMSLEQKEKFNEIYNILK